MSKASNRIGFILGLLGVALLSGCGVTSTKLPSNLPPGGGGFLTIGTTQFPDAITGRSYYLVISTTGGSGVLSNCAVVSGHLPSGLAWSVSSTQSNNCILSGSAVGGVGAYSVVVQATDTSSPPKTDQLPYTLTVRPEFSITQSTLVDAVQGRTYGISPLSQVVTTNLVGAATPQVGQGTEFGNGPIVTCNPAASPFAIAPSNPGLTITSAPTQSQCVLTSTAPLNPSGAYTVTVSVTDNPITLSTQSDPVVPARTITKTFNLTVNPPISFSANFDNYSYTPTGVGNSAELPDAVLNRTYGAIGAYGTGAAGGKTSVIFSATGGLLTTQGLTFTPPANSSLPAPVQCGPATGSSYPQVSNTAATLVCGSGGAPVSASPAAFSFGVTVADAGNAATPPASISSDALGHSSHTVTVDPTLSFSLAQAGNPTPTNPATLLDAVTGRTYGVVGGTPTYTPVGGLGANSAGSVGNSYYQWCLSSGNLPATFSTAGSNLNAPCSAQVESNSPTLQATSDLTQAVVSATAFPFTVQLNDTGNPTTPSATLTNSTSLTVQPPLMATVVQSTNATPATALLPGVFNRTYGVIGGTPTFSAAGGLGLSLVGLGHYQWCISAGALPTGFLNTGSNVNTPCTAPDVENTATLAASPITQNVVSATAFPFTIRLDDQGNPAVPSGVASGTINAISTSILVDPQIQLAQSLTANWPDAVSGRPYGSGTNCTGGACAPAVYTATNGLGGYVWPATTPASIAAVTGITCPAVAVGSATFTCSAADVTAPPTSAGASSIFYSPSATVTDTPNAAVPAATTSTDPASTRTDTLWVDAPLLATLNQTGDTPVLNPANLLPGVANRSYGTIGATPTYSATGGLGSRTVTTYEWCVNTGTASLPTGLTGITVGGSGTPCSTFGPTAINSATLTAASITATITPPSQAFPFTVELDDTGNASTPSSVGSSTSATNATSVLINSPLVIHLTQATNGTDPTNLLPGVTNRTYGSIGGTPTYTASYGLGGYVFPASPGPYPTGFTCSSTTTNPYLCSANTAVGAAPATYPLSLTVSDTSNPAVPNGSVTSNTSLLINPQIQLAQSLTAAWPDAVHNRPYGTGANCTGGACAPAIYSATNGLGGYVWPASTPASIAAITGLTCPAVVTGNTTYTCSAATVTAAPATAGAAAVTYNPSATVTDTANAAVPAATTTTDPASTRTDALVVDSPLLATLTQNAITNPANLLPGVSGRSYATIGAIPTYTSAGGLGLATVGVGHFQWCISVGALPAGFLSSGTNVNTTCASPDVENTATVSATNVTATITPPSQNFPFTLELDDPGNASTPSSVATTTSATRATALLVNAPLAVQLTQTGNGASPNPASLIPGVTGRSYATISGGSAAPTYTASFGLGGFVYPATPGPFGAGSGFNCSTTSSNPYSCSSAAVSLAGSGTPYAIALTVSDTANAAVPHGTATSNTNLLVNLEMTVTAPVVPVAVHGRAYGTGTGCSPTSACAPLQYSLNNGLGNYTLAGSSLTTPSDTFTCSLASPVFSCSKAAIAGAGNTNPPLTFTGAETGNAATPGNSVTDTSKTLTTHLEMTVTPPASVPTAVHLRAYGTGTGCSPTSACAALPYSLNNGLGNYTLTGTTLTTPSDAFTCTIASPTFSCSKGSIATAGGTSPTLTFTGAETGNASTPGNSVTDTSKTLATNLEMTVTAPGTVLPAVHNRAYGTGTGCLPTNACAPVQYSLSHGLGNYTATGSSLSDGTDTFALAFSTPNFDFSDATITGAGGTTPTLTFTGAETGNASTPGNSVSNTAKTLAIDSQLALTVDIGGAGFTSVQPWPLGVTARPYGTGTGCSGIGGNCSPPTYTAANGLGGYTFPTTTGITAMGFACVTASPTLTCTAASLSAGSPSVTATDTANQATPKATTTTDPNSILTSSLTVNPELAITNTFLENATVGEPYSATLDSNRGGLGFPYVWCAGTISTGPTCTPSGGIAGVSFGTPSPAFSDDPSSDIRGYYRGTPTASGSVATTIRVADDGNATTPSCATPGTCPSLALTTAAVEPKVLKSSGFVANNFSDNLLPFDFNAFTAGTAVDLSTGGAGTPTASRVTPDGQWVYVTRANGKISVVNPLTGAEARTDITTATAAGTGNPGALDIEPQQFFTAIPTACSVTPCSNLSPHVRYDAWIIDPDLPAGGSAKVEPIPEAENPGMVPSTLVSGNASTLNQAFSIAITPDALQAWVGSLTGCTPVTVCNTLTPFTLPALSASLATTYPATAGATFGNIGLTAGAVAADPRGNYVYTVETTSDGTKQYIAITTTAAYASDPTDIVGYLPHTAFAGGTAKICQAGGTATDLTVSPDGNRLFITCQNDPNNTVEVWDVSQGDGTLLGSDTSLTTPIATINLPVSLDNTTAAATLTAENGCTTPVDIKAKLSDESVFGTRVFVACKNSDTVVAINYNSGQGSNAFDSFTATASQVVISTDAAPITNAATFPYVNACTQTGSSCPESVDLTPNPAMHFVSGGYAPAASPVALAREINSTPYWQYVAMAGGTVPRTFSNPGNVLGTDPNCAGLSLNTSTGEITGTAANTSVTCGGVNGFIIRVVDASGQIVERAFTIPIN